MSPIAHLLDPSGAIPNHPRWPLLIYPEAISEVVGSDSLRRWIESNEWTDTWTNGIFTYHHFHSNAHEVLACFSGEAEVQFGGEDGPIEHIRAGDAVIIPAGVGHCNLGESEGFGVVGGYPINAKDRDLCRGNEFSEEEFRQRIDSVPLPASDPIFGKDGPIFEYWSR